MEEQSPPPIGLDRDSATIIVNGPEVASGTSENVTDVPADDRPGVSGVHLLLMCLDEERHVTFHEDVIDNEGMNRRKSKCCCIYRKPHVFGESSSSSDDECEHCCGHPEVRVCNRLKKQQQRNTYPCGCPRSNDSQQQQQQHQPDPVLDEPPRPTEIAGDSGNVKPIAEPSALVNASSQTLQP